MRIVLEGCSVVSVDDKNTVLPRAWVEITDGLITALSTESLDTTGVDRRIDVSGMIVMPGLVNIHTHTFQTLIRGVYEQIGFTEWLRAIYRCGPVLTTNYCHVAARLGALESIRSGVTTLVDHHFLNRDTELAEATIEGMRDTGIRTGLARTIMDTGDIVPREMVETPEAGLRSVEELLRTYQPQSSDGMVTIMTGPNTPGVNASGELIQATAAFAGEHDLIQSMHLAESISVVKSVQDLYGVQGVIDWLEQLDALGPRVIAAHGVHMSSDEVQILAKRNVSVSHSPVSNMFLGDGIAPVAELLAAGVNVALATDGPASNNSQDMFEVLKFSGLLQRAKNRDDSLVPPTQAIRMATVNGARATGLDHLIGSVEVGKRADLIVLDLGRRPHTVACHDIVSQLVYCAKSSDVIITMVNGEILMDQGVISAIDESAFLSEARKAGDQLVATLR